MIANPDRVKTERLGGLGGGTNISEHIAAGERADMGQESAVLHGYPSLRNFD
jgi:hypothetical protein